MNAPNDPFIELGLIEKLLGKDEAIRIAKKFSDDIENTNNWQDDLSEKYATVEDYLKKNPRALENLYFDAYKLFDDPEEVGKFRAAGFDGAIHAGSGATAHEVEYKVFKQNESFSRPTNSNSARTEPTSPRRGSREEIGTARLGNSFSGHPQIKSIHNRGTFDPNDARILYALRKPGTREAAAKESAVRAAKDAFSAGAGLKAIRTYLSSTNLDRVSKAKAEVAAERILRDAKKSGDFEQAAADYVLKNEILNPTGTIKQMIASAVNQRVTGTEIVSSKAALDQTIRLLQSEADNVSLRKGMRQGLEIRNELRRQAKDALPGSIQGKMLNTVANAKNAKDLTVGLEKIRTLLDEHEHSMAVTDLKSLMSELDPNKMRPEFKARVEELIGNLDEKRMAPGTKEHLDALAEYVAKTKEKYPDRLDDISSETLDAIKRLGKKPIADHTTAEIREIHDALQRAVFQNETANLLISGKKAQSLAEATDKIVSELEKNDILPETEGERRPGREQPNVLRRLSMEGTGMDAILSGVAGEGGELHKYGWKNIAGGKSQMYKIMYEMRDILDAHFKANNFDKYKQIEWRHKRVPVRLSDGKVHDFTRAELISIYLNSANRETREMMTGKGGIVQRGFAGEKGQGVKLTTSDLNRLRGMLTPFERQTAEVMLGVFNGPLKKYLNDASLESEGYHKFLTENYWPRSADREQGDLGFLDADLKKMFKKAKLENSPFTKSRQEHEMPIVVGDALNEFERHLRSAAAYSAMTAPVRDMLMITRSSDVGTAIKQRVGDQFERVMDEYLTSASGLSGKSVSEFESKWNMVTRAVVASKLGLRASTMFFNAVGAPIQYMAEMSGAEIPKYMSAYSRMTPAESGRLYKEASSHNAYFRERYSGDPSHIVSFGGREHVERLAGKGAYQRWKDVQEVTLKPMQAAERRATMARYKQLKESGLSPQEAADKLMLETRATQNAIDDLDKPSLVRNMQGTAAGPVLALTSQSFKFRDMLLRYYSKWQKSGGLKNKEATREFLRKGFLVFVSAALIPGIPVTKTIRSAGKEQDQSKNRFNFLDRAVSGSADLVFPKLGDFVNSIQAYAKTGRSDAVRSITGDAVANMMEGSIDLAHAAAEDADKVHRNNERTKEQKLADATKKFLIKGVLPVIGTPGAEAAADYGEGIKRLLSAGDPALHLKNERSKIKQKLPTQKEGESAEDVIDRAVKSGAISREEMRRLETLESSIRDINANLSAIEEKTKMADKEKDPIRREKLLDAVKRMEAENKRISGG